MYQKQKVKEYTFNLSEVFYVCWFYKKLINVLTPWNQGLRGVYFNTKLIFSVQLKQYNFIHVEKCSKQNLSSTVVLGLKIPHMSFDLRWVFLRSKSMRNPESMRKMDFFTKIFFSVTFLKDSNFFYDNTIENIYMVAYRINSYNNRNTIIGLGVPQAHEIMLFVVCLADLNISNLFTKRCLQMLFHVIGMNSFIT